jgi:transposase
MIETFRSVRELMVTIPGISTTVTDIIIAEIGVYMSRFPTAGHLASWAGTCPGSNLSAGRVKSTHTRPGNPYLKGALGIAAMSAVRSKNTYFSAKYRRIASRRGPIKAVVALKHAMLVAIWNMLQTGETYSDLAGGFFTKRSPDKAKSRALDELRNLGYTVILEPSHEAA